MISSQAFHLPGSYKKSRTSEISSTRRGPYETKDKKAQLILGITGDDVNGTHKSSVKLQDISLSDATTEFDAFAQSRDKYHDYPALSTKASSTLLRNQAAVEMDGSSSIHTGRLRNYDSSSTLHSYYDRQKAPLSVSQQTSDSSRRDFALRKGAPVVVTNTTPEKDSLLQLKLFKSSKSRSKREPNKLSKPPPGSDINGINWPSGLRSAEWTLPSVPTSPSRIGTAKSDGPSRSRSGRSNTDSAETVVLERPTQLPIMHRAMLDPADPASVKMNIRKPRTKTQHWFDGIESDSSDEDAVDEPQLEPTFAHGIEKAFLTGKIGVRDSSPRRKLGGRSDYSTTEPDFSPTPKSSKDIPHKPRIVAEVPRVATLNAKASKASISQQSHQSRRKANPLEKANLNQVSVLNLSSSDDEEESATESAPTAAEPVKSIPAIRDSIAACITEDSEIEIGTAQAVRTNPSLGMRVAPNLQNIITRPNDIIPPRRSSRLNSYLSDLSSDPNMDEGDPLDSFPATPVETSSHRSFRSSMCFSDNASVESRRLMSVTRQEESLLAAMRLKKATMQYNPSQNMQGEGLRSVDRMIPRSYHMSGSTISSLDSSSRFRGNLRRVAHSNRDTLNSFSMSDDEFVPSRASATTFQTNTSVDPNSRYPRNTYQSTPSNDRLTRFSSSSEHSAERSASPSPLSLMAAERRASRDTYFSTSTADTRNQVRSEATESDDIESEEPETPVKREDVRSQDFISWPYTGWDAARSELGLAH